jgi:hypothetical protein
MPTNRCRVKWGELILRGDRSSKDDKHRKKKEREELRVLVEGKDTYYIISQQARATTQHAKT